MSVYEVSHFHIDAMLTAGFVIAERNQGKFSWHDDGQHRYLNLETAGRVGAMLAAENRRSVNHRYADEDLEQPYLFRRLFGSPDPVTVLKILACYEYQTCEHPEWPATEAYAFVQALRARWIACLPGYSDAPGWEVNSPSVFTQPARSRS